MAILAQDSFAAYPDIATTSQGLQSEWMILGGANQGSMVPGRFGGQAVKNVGSLNTPFSFGKALYVPGAGNATQTIRFALNYTTTAHQAGDIMQTRNNGNGGTVVIAAGFNTSDQLYIAVSGSTVYTYPTPISQGSWRSVGIAWTGGVAGWIDLYIDGVKAGGGAHTFSGNTSTLTADFIQFNNLTANAGFVQAITIGDYIHTDSATWLGERWIEPLVPSSNASVAWTPLSGANWTQVKELPCDGDTTYNSTVTAGATDTFGIVSLSTTPLTIENVRVKVAVRKTDATTHNLHAVMKSGAAALSEGPDFAVAGTYLYAHYDLPTDPNTAVAWTPSGVNGSQPGYKLVT